MHVRSIYRQSLAVALAAAALVAAPPAHAADASLHLEFRCAQGGDESYNILCVPIASASARAIADSDAATQPAAGANAGARRNHLRPVAMRSEEEIFSADGWYVPLYGPPTDMDGVRELLRAVLCGRHADCVIHYYGNEKFADMQGPLR